MSDFDCGVKTLNNYLITQAFASTRDGFGRTYIASSGDDKEVLGYYSISVAAVNRDYAPSVPSGTPAQIPVVLLGRLAVSKEFQGQGLGAHLLIHACQQAIAVSNLVGAAMIEVHTLNDKAKSFYEKYGFESFLDDERHMFLPMSSVLSLGA